MRNLCYPLVAVLLSCASISAARAGNVTLGYTSGSAKTSDTTLFDNPAGAYLFVGYQSKYLFGFEFGVFGLYDPNSAATTTDDVSLSGKSLTMTFNLPLGFVTLFARGGLADWGVYQDQTRTYSGHSPTYGGGITFHFNENWAARAEQQRFMDIGPSNTDVIHTRIGIVYIFD